jgi:FkbM family methyltransferase
MKKIILPNTNIAVLEGDSHLAEWVKASGRLDHDPMIETLSKYIAPGTVAIDVGASIGDHTAGYLKSQAAMVVAFEPNPAAFECLVHNCPNAMKFHCALGAAPDIKVLHINHPNYGASFVAGIGVTSSDESYYCHVMPLDMIRFPHRISFIKMDVEGFEPDVLMGAEETIQRDRPVLCLEINKGALERNSSSPVALLKELCRLGYMTGPVPRTAVDDQQWDCLAIPT